MENFGKSEDIVIFSPNFDEICRTCTKTKSESLHQIFNSEICIHNEENPISTSEVLFGVSTLKMLPDDGLPKGICIQCLESLKKAYHFQKMCILSDLAMRNLKQSYREQINTINDQSSRKEGEDKSGKIIGFDLPNSSANKNRVNILISGTLPLIEPVVHCDAPVIDYLKNIGTSDDLKKQV